MPTYDYVCEACEHTFELFQKMSDGPKKKCPECGELKLKRLIGTGAGCIFKGSGFYETDYKRRDRYAEKLKQIPDTPENRKKAEDREI
jgi:putative FmdB family regulatory protein